MNAPRRIGVVGLGNIGEQLCRNLLKHDFEVAVFDANPAAMERLGDTEARPVDSASAVASESEVVVLSLPNSEIVERIVTGEDGLLESMSEGDVVIDTSSSRPPSTRELAQRLSESGIDMLDAPVSGGVAKAREGKLSVMVGGDKDIFERCRGVLEAFGERVVRVGGAGTGHLVKSLNNLLSATTMVSAAEAMMLARSSGVDPQTFIEVINAGNGRSYSTEVKFPNFVLDGDFDGDGFALDLMAKDVGIALQSALDAGHPMLVGAVISQLWRAAANNGYGDRGHTSIVEYIERMTLGDE